MQTFSKPSQYPAFFTGYLAHVPEDGRLLDHLESVLSETVSLVSALSDDLLSYRYAEGKWTIKDIIGHINDAERILIYRALCFTRGDLTPLPGFDENLYVLNAHAEKRDIIELLEELSAQRKSSIQFIKSLGTESLSLTGNANGNIISVGLLVNIICGHHRHHLELIKERYLHI